MRIVVQRVSRARVTVNSELAGEIGAGFLLLVGVETGDTSADVDYIAEKIAGLRICDDGAGKMNLSLRDTGGAVLAVSQFTLLGDVRRGLRPSFDRAERPERAAELYRQLVAVLRSRGLTIAEGVFGAMMDVELVNKGPVTIFIDSRERSSA